jgi:hypothetical protein
VLCRSALAKWKTTSTPFIAARKPRSSIKLQTATSTGTPLGNSGDIVEGRNRVLTGFPIVTNWRINSRPTKPVPPVTRIIGVDYNRSSPAKRKAVKSNFIIDNFTIIESSRLRNSFTGMLVASHGLAQQARNLWMHLN